MSILRSQLWLLQPSPLYCGEVDGFSRPEREKAAEKWGLFQVLLLYAFSVCASGWETLEQLLRSEDKQHSSRSSSPTGSWRPVLFNSSLAQQTSRKPAAVWYLRQHTQQQLCGLCTLKMDYGNESRARPGHLCLVIKWRKHWHPLCSLESPSYADWRLVKNKGSWA